MRKRSRRNDLRFDSVALEGRRSFRLSYGRIVGYSLVLLLLQFQFGFQLFRNFEALWRNRKFEGDVLALSLPIYFFECKATPE